MSIKQDINIKAYLRNELSEYMGNIGHMTSEEKRELLEWVEDGNHVYSNPSLISDDNGNPMDFISAHRIAIDMFESMTTLGYEQMSSASQTMDSEYEEPF